MIETTVPPKLLPLKDGEAVSREEYFARAALTPGVRMERLNGRVRMAAAIRRDYHGRPQSRVDWILTHYEVETPGVEASSPATSMLGDGNDPEADCHLLVLPEYGGQVSFTDDGYIDGCPELMVEIAASSLRTDLVTKRELYEAAGCREYIVWATEKAEFVIFLRESERLVEASFEGVFQSRAFPGLWIDCDALLRGDLKAALATLNEGLATAEHAAYVERLAAATS